MVICLERGAELHMAQLMPLPLTVSCFSNIQIGFTFLVPAHPGSPGQKAVKRVCVCVCAYVWILLKQERVSGSGISWTICKSASWSRQISMQAPHRSVFYRPDALPATQPTASKHSRHTYPHIQCTHKSVTSKNVNYNRQLLSGTSAGFWFGGSMPPCHLRQRKFWNLTTKRCNFWSISE